MKKYIISAFALAFVIGLAGNAHAAANLSGWAYSNGIGWISLSSITPNSGGCGGGTCSYGVTISTTTSPTVGTFDGYGWSSNVGWISFKQADVSQCGSQAQVDLSTGNPTSGAVTGWARVISGSADSGWDGCVKLSDPVKFASPNNNNTLFPGVTTDGGITFGVDPTKSNYRKFGGFSWGDMNVGWMIFNMVLCPDCIGGINQNTLSATCSSNPSPANLSNTGGSVTFNANAQGGTPPYKYYWDGDTITQGQAISKVKNYGAGNNTYNELLQVSDSGGSTPVNPICPQVTVGTGGNGANNGQCGSYVYTDRTCGAGTWTDRAGWRDPSSGS